MGEFFKGWRRKAGIVTLVMGLVLMVGWVRSVRIEDTILVHWGTNTIFVFLSENGSAQWCFSERAHPSAAGTSYISWTSRESSGDFSLLDFALGFGLSTGKYEIDYLSIGIPLTLLSAYLLLNKQRPKKPPTESP